MNMAELCYEERKRIRRAAEDARDACNRHYGPFVDVVAHPINILKLLDMADRAVDRTGAIGKLHLFGPDGKELHVQRGKTFVGLLPDDVEDALTYGPRTPPVDPAAASSATAPASDG